MSKRHNTAFLNRYMELDKLCCERFGVNTGSGVIEYINRLSNARFAPGRDEVLSRLIGYSNTQKRFHYEPAAIRNDHQITKHDVNWITRFKFQFAKRRDPISRYLKKTRSYDLKNNISAFLWGAAILAIAAAVITLIIILK